MDCPKCDYPLTRVPKISSDPQYVDKVYVCKKCGDFFWVGKDGKLEKVF